MSATNATPILTYKPTGPGVHVDLDRLVASRMLVQANSGGGKSRAIRQLLEETHGRVQHIVIDPEGEFPTLRERFDYVLAAKSGGEALASPKTARKLCRRLVELGASAVLDIYELEIHERREFVNVFLTELINLPRTLWRPLLVVIDEAHTFCPQSGESSASAAVISLCTLGRKRGFAAILATQRISKLHKDAAAELNNKLIGRTGLDVDVKRAGDELGFDKEGRERLPRLGEGEFFAYGPAISPVVTLIKTGEVQTTHPQPGQVTAAPPPPPAKIRAMLAQLIDLPKEAEEEARTLDDYKRQNAELARKLRQAEKAEKSGTTPAKPVTIVDQKAIDRAVSSAVSTAVKPYADVLMTVKRAVISLVVPAQQLSDRLAALQAIEFDVKAHTNGNGNGNKHAGVVAPALAGTGSQPGGASVRTVPQRAMSRAPSRGPLQPLEPSESGGPLAKGVMTILRALAQYPDVTRDQLSVLTGLRRSTRNEYLRQLIVGGFVEDTGQTLTATDAGMDALGDSYEPLPTGEALQRHWIAKLSEGQGRLLQALIDAYPDAISREQLDELTGLRRSTRNEYLRQLIIARVVEDMGSGQVRASATLFDEARR